MTTELGAEIVKVLEGAGSHYLEGNEPDLYRTYLLNLCGTDALRRYDGSGTYWGRVQSILDAFFLSPERAEIGIELIERVNARRLPECRQFVAEALAERRMQELLGRAAIAPSAALRQNGPSRAP